MTTVVIPWVLGVGGLVAALILALGSLARLRDEMVAGGWISQAGRLGRMATRARVVGAIATLQAVGLDEAAAQAVRMAGVGSRARARKLARSVHKRPDTVFLKRARRWIVELDPGFEYKGSRFYLDIMGAMSGREEYELGIDQIFMAWIEALKQEGVVPYFDAVLVPKDGNVLLCRAVAERLDVPLILCKGEKDKARVARPEPSAHETDFEGLRLFCERERGTASLPGRKYRVLAIDDSCSGGSQLASAVQRFNAYAVDGRRTGDVMFERVSCAAVLFRVLGAQGVSNDALGNASLALHSMVSLGERQLESLRAREPRDSDDLSSFKEDRFACGASLRLLHA